MSICHISGEDLKKIEPLFENWNETLIWSCLQGYMGTAWADNKVTPKSAQIVIADFCFLAGRIDETLVKHRPKEHSYDFIIMVPQNMEWAKLIEEVYGENTKQVTRYAIKKEPNIFDCHKLNKYVVSVGQDYEIKLINEQIFEIVRQAKWSYDLCSQFENFDAYAKRGLGVVAIHNGEIVSGASSYTVYKEGIEIEIDTREDYRRKGLALACGAKLILECIDRNIYPSWDAQNKGSLALAEKLGYHFDKEYVAYEVVGYGEK